MADKDVDLQKVRTLENYFLAWRNLASSLIVSGFVALLVVTLTIYYQEKIMTWVFLFVPQYLSIDFVEMLHSFCFR